MRWTGDECVMQRVRLRGSALDPLTSTLRVSTALNALSLRPAGLAPAAILCVRLFQAPGGLDLRRLDAGIPSNWSRASASELDRILTRAVRPALQSVVGDVAAVLFDDRAELLACFARDWLDGRAASRWWWPVLLGPQAVTRPAAPWLESPREAPAALSLLVTWGRGHAFVQALSNAEATALTRQMLVARGAVELLDALTVQPGGTGLSVAIVHDVDVEKPNQTNPASIPSGRSSTPPVPWLRIASEVDDKRSPPNEPQQTLLGIGLSLHRAPAIALSRPFADRVRRWRLAAEIRDDLRQSATGEQLRNEVVQVRTEPAAGTDVAEFRQESRVRVVPLDLDIKPPTPAWPASMESPSSPPRELVSPTVEAEACEVRTQLGGLFYLLNLALYLDLYGDFTTPERRGLELSPWDFITLVGRGLLGGGFDSDAVWPLLAGLAARAPHEPPGRDFTPDPEWRLPAEWLQPFGESAPLQWIPSEGWLRVWHPAGFLVLDVERLTPAERLACRQMRRMKDNCDTSMQHPDNVFPGISGGAQLWLARLLPYVRARLALAMGIDDRDQAVQVLCRVDGRVFVTATRVDVSFSLADLPIGVRLAGLDRDPGWMPAAGRTIAFHFDEEASR